MAAIGAHVSVYQKPAHWADWKNKLFPYQVGFTCPPRDFYDGGSWHEKLKGSTGLKPQKPGYTDISSAPDRAKQLYEKVRPHYEHLYEYRLKDPLRFS